MYRSTDPAAPMCEGCGIVVARASSPSRGARLPAGCYLNRRVAVQDPRPTSRLHRQEVEAGDCRGLQELVDAVGRQGNVDVLGNPADVAVPPHRPSAAEPRYCF